MTRQREFVFDRGEQRRLLDRAVLPRRPGVAPASCAAVLYSIDHYGRGGEAWPSVETLASRSRLSVRTVKRAIRVLSELSLISIRRRGALTLNHYRIEWSNLALLVPEDSASGDPTSVYSPSPSAGTADPPACGRVSRGDSERERSAMVSKRSAMVSKRSAMVAHELLEEGLENKPPVRRRSAEGEDRSEVVEAARRTGVYDLRTVHEAIDRTDVGHVGSILEYYASRPGDYGAGALCVRLKRARPGLDASAGWPPIRERKLQLSPALSGAEAVRRSELIAHGKAQGWTFQHLQWAVSKFETESIDKRKVG